MGSKLPLDDELQLAAVLLRARQGLLEAQMKDCATMVGYVADDVDRRLRQKAREASKLKAKVETIREDRGASAED